MAAPKYVPVDPVARPNSYSSNPSRGGAWIADRPGDMVGGLPVGDRLGTPGPDMGFAMKIAKSFENKLQLTEAEHLHDVIGGCVAVAMKRASIFGRAPVIHDLTVAFTVWGFLGAAPDELVEIRRRMFEGVGHAAHHYGELRAVADAVPNETLQLSPDTATSAHADNWRSLLRLG